MQQKSFYILIYYEQIFVKNMHKYARCWSADYVHMEVVNRRVRHAAYNMAYIII